MTQIIVTNGDLDPAQERAISRASNIAARKRRCERNNAIEKAHRSFYNYFNEHHDTVEAARLLHTVIGELRDNIRRIG